VSTYRISQLAEHAGIPTTTLRYYEKEGLVPAARTQGGYRLYTDADRVPARPLDPRPSTPTPQRPPTGDAGPGSPVVACSLDGDGYSDRIRQWRSLLADADREEPRGGGVTVRLPAVHAGRLAELVVAEQECCPFLDFVLTFDGSHVAVTVRAPEGAEPLVAALFDSEPVATEEPRNRC
jgi:hypothetical protein